MTEPQKINDALPPKDGWVGIVFPLSPFPAITADEFERALDALGAKPFEGTLEGTWNDMEAP